MRTGLGPFLSCLQWPSSKGFSESTVSTFALWPSRAPRSPLTAGMPLGMIGEPAALLQAAEGTDLRLGGVFQRHQALGHLVARPGIKTPRDLRGKRLGARVIGAGLWISTILALEQLALDPQRDEITILP